MRRTIALVACVLPILLGGVGCQSFTYVQRDQQGGVIEFKASEKEGVIAKLKQEEGDIEIEAVVPKSKPATGGLFDPKQPVGMSDRMASAVGANSSGDDDKVQLKYRKKGVTPAGLPPADDRGVTTAGYKTQYDRTPGVGSATVVPVGGKSNTTLPAVDLNGTSAGGR